MPSSTAPYLVRNSLDTSESPRSIIGPAEVAISQTVKFGTVEFGAVKQDIKHHYLFSNSQQPGYQSGHFLTGLQKENLSGDESFAHPPI